MQEPDAYELLDTGGGARLERFGDRIVDRPHPTALGSRRDPGRWRDADLRFDRDRGWAGQATALDPWPIEVAGLTLELRPTEAGQVGLFPEHLAMLPWLTEQVSERTGRRGHDAEARPGILNLFAYTGLVSLAAASAGAAVTHVDSSRPTVTWARQNAERSSLVEGPIRWIVDDALAFIGREIRRGRRYDGVVLDPPSYGHGPAGETWRIGGDLPSLLQGAAALLQPGGFVLLTAHSEGFGAERLASDLGTALAKSWNALARGVLAVTTEDGRQLQLGAFARWPGAA